MNRMKSLHIVLLMTLAVACLAAAEDGTIVPLSDLKKSQVLKPKPADDESEKAPEAAPYVETESAPTPAIPALPYSAPSGEIPTVPDVPDLPSAGDMPGVMDPPASNTSAPKPSADNPEDYSDVENLPAPMGPMGPATAAAFGTRDMLGKKVIPVTSPRDQRVVHPKSSPNALAENASVIGQVGNIYKSPDGWFWVKYESIPGKATPASQRLLPCRILQSVEEIIATKPNTRFGIYGQATLYDGMTYLLLRRVSIEDDNKKRIDEVTMTDTTTDEKYKPMQVEKSTKPVAVTKTAEPSSAADAISQTDNLLAGLMNETSGRTIRTSDAPARSAVENKVSVAPAGKEPLTQERENLVADRLARVVKSKHSDWYEVHFISDNTLREPPYLILPNSKLDDSLRLNSYLGFHERKLRISGEVIYYKGRRYIMLTKVFPERDMRQF